MCGITGTYNLIDPSLIKKMLSEIHHRGPDDTGFCVVDNVMLGIKRLSILDIEMGVQPMFSADKSKTLVFNGEIFNFIELKKELIKKDVKFYTKNSDTEVILKLYEFYGIKFLEKLNGMFSIALYDKKIKKLFLARDRVGIKNIFYSYTNNHLVFGSEIKAILKSNLVKRKPNLKAIFNFFSYKNIPSPETAFDNIYQVMPGEVIEVNSNGTKKSRFWDLKIKEIENYDEDELEKKILTTLEKSVKMQLRSDVEVGFFLSGGLDSSAVTYLSSLHTKKKLKTFTLVYEDSYKQKMQDRIFAKKISKLVDSDHFEFFIDEKKVFENLDNALKSFDQPFGGVISMYYLAKEISKHVKVALSGDGADELFGSYLLPRIINPIKLFSEPNEKNIEELKKYTEFSDKKEYLKKFANDSYALIKNKLGTFDDEEKKNLFSENILSLNFSSVNLNEQIFRNFKNIDPINISLAFDFLTLLPDQVLSFVDILSMVHSLEVRPPFLENEMIDLSFQIHGNRKVKYSQVKNILKKSLEKILPKELIYRKKEGFVMPLEEMFISKKISYIKDVLSKKNLKKHDFFNYNYIDNILNTYEENNFKTGQKIWLIYCFQTWWNSNF